MTTLFAQLLAGYAREWLDEDHPQGKRGDAVSHIFFDACLV